MNDWILEREHFFPAKYCPKKLKNKEMNWELKTNFNPDQNRRNQSTQRINSRNDLSSTAHRCSWVRVSLDRLLSEIGKMVMRKKVVPLLLEFWRLRELSNLVAQRIWPSRMEFSPQVIVIKNGIAILRWQPNFGIPIRRSWAKVFKFLISSNGQ